jgi:DNA ligase D-like protein (predicted ligase)/DNA ligase D-like protein (predicted 3'-phosphoesterase)
MTLLRPMLAESAERPFSSGDWIFEVKWDGIRAISYVYEELSIRSRSGRELRQNFPELGELRDLTSNVTLDGEIILLKEGKVDFQAVMTRVQRAGPSDIGYLSRRYPATYVVFDILEKEGQSLADRPLVERKKILRDTVKEGRYVVLSAFVEAQGEAYYRAALERGLEGIVAKRKDSRYTFGARSRDWLKIKSVKTCECIVVGYTRGRGNRRSTFGALLLGLYGGKQLIYVGKVGTGFDSQSLEELRKILASLERAAPLRDVDVAEEVTWLKPTLVCEVAYQLLTEDTKLRMPRFRGLRPDKGPEECTIDQVKPTLLKEYAERRDFTTTPEPRGHSGMQDSGTFVVQEHLSRRRHFDLRLERDGVLKSWAIPLGLPEKPGVRRLAVQTEDHPIEYRSFEGVIPRGQYGAGTVNIWDRGLHTPLLWSNDKIEFLVAGKKLSGRYVLVRMKKAAEEKDWLLMKVGE